MRNRLIPVVALALVLAACDAPVTQTNQSTAVTVPAVPVTAVPWSTAQLAAADRWIAAHPKDGARRAVLLAASVDGTGGHWTGAVDTPKGLATFSAQGDSARQLALRIQPGDYYLSYDYFGVYDAQVNQMARLLQRGVL